MSEVQFPETRAAVQSPDFPLSVILLAKDFEARNRDVINDRKRAEQALSNCTEKVCVQREIILSLLEVVEKTERRKAHIELIVAQARAATEGAR